MGSRWPDTYKERRFWRERRGVAVGDALPRLLEGLDRKGALRLTGLWRRWEQVVGSEVASLARPLGARGRALVLLSEDPMTAQHLSFLATEILGRVNAHLGEHRFDELRFELADGRAPLDRPAPTAPAPKDPPQRPEKLGSLADEVDPDSPVGRAYLAYLKMFADEDHEDG